MYWAKDDETFFTILLYSNLGFFDPDNSWSVSAELCGIAEAMTVCRGRRFRHVQVVIKFAQLTERLRSFEQFIQEPGIRYDANNNRVQATQECFDRFPPNVECRRWREFRQNDMANLLALREIKTNVGIDRMNWDEILNYCFD